MTRRTALDETHLDDGRLRRGKVRDIYDLGERLLIVASDRISAYDWVLPTGIPDKGRVLTGLSVFWFELLDVPHHLITVDLEKMDVWEQLPAARRQRDELAGRSMLVHKAEVAPVECVVRGYLSGSGWREYRQTGSVCGIRLAPGLRESDRLPEPIFTPATKAQSGHDENISFDRMCEMVGPDVADELRGKSLRVYRQAAEYALDCGIMIADTKFEWGRYGGRWILVDEVLTPDSSRFWPVSDYQPGRGQPSFDKQFVRDWLDGTTWDKNSTPPPLPETIVQKTRDKYIEAYERLTGKAFAWK